ASSVGGIVAIDFEDPREPKVNKLEIDFTKSGYALCIIDSQSSHADLTGAYAGIPTEMNAVAGVFDREHLRQMTMDELIQKTGEVRRRCGDRAFLRAVHFLLENRRAQDEARALDNGDFDRFLTLVSESGRSSAMYLQNTVVAGQVKDQAVNVVLALCDVLLAGKGAFRVHGGGFAGTVQAFVPLSELEAFKRQMEGAVGPGCCHVLTIRPVGGAVI
ncbi:MAG: galactokinase, partial [Eubacteriaceae bacterium]|nr:galactokinase [Eubacteriaceae bacterium]